jgi:hypothetical protein
MSVPLRLGERFVDHSRTDRVNTNAKKVLPWELAPKPKSAFIKAKLAAKRKAESMDPDECAGKGI